MGKRLGWGKHPGGNQQGLVKHLPHKGLISSGGHEGSASTGCGGVASIGI